MPTNSSPIIFYPECTKLALASEESKKLGYFLDWLQEKGIDLNLVYNPEELLAEYFDIDLKKIEKERRDILKNIQEKPPLK